MSVFIKYVLIFQLSVFLLGCASAEVPKSTEVQELPKGYKEELLPSPRLVNGTTFSRGSKLIFDNEGFLRTAILGEDQPILDANYKKQMPHIFKSGSILQYKEPKNSFGDLNKNLDIPKTITIRKPTEIYGIQFEVGTTFIFPSEGKKAFLGIAVERTRSDLVIGGKKIQAGSTVLFEDKDKVKILVKGEWVQP